MKYTYTFDEDNGICTIAVTGTVKRPDDSQILQQFARNFDKETGCQKFLYDMRRARFIGGTMDVYNTGAFLADTDHKQRRQKTALVYDEITDDNKFMETVAINRGYKFRVFDQEDMEKAMEWLTE